MLPALSQALFELSGVDVAAEAFRPDAIPAYLRFNCRLVGERGQSIAASRDIGALLEQHVVQARDALRRASPPVEWERSDIVTWDLGGNLPHIGLLV